jgi:hypothetical protein
MNLANIDAKVSELTKADATTAYPTANRLINYNIWNQKIVSMIIDSQDTSDFEDANRSGYSTLSVDLVQNQRDYRFGIADGVIEVRRVDVTYDGVNSYRSTPVDSSELDVGLIDGATDVDTFFSSTSPAHDWKYNALFLYPMPTASVGSLSVEVSRTAKDVTSEQYTAGTMVPGFDENFHPMIAYGMSLEYFISNGMSEQAAQTSQILSDYEVRLRRQYGKKEREYPLRFQSEFVDYN